jgi:hypothetical protein
MCTDRSGLDFRTRRIVWHPSAQWTVFGVTDRLDEKGVQSEDEGGVKYRELEERLWMRKETDNYLIIGVAFEIGTTAYRTSAHQMIQILPTIYTIVSNSIGNVEIVSAQEPMQ